jgi:hypothetical protein
MISTGNPKNVGVNMLQYCFIHMKSSWIEREVARWEGSPEPPDESMQNLLFHFILFFCVFYEYET